MIRFKEDQQVNATIAATTEKKQRQRQIDLVKTLEAASRRGKESEVMAIFRDDLSPADKQFLDSVLESPVFTATSASEVSAEHEVVNVEV